ncbi:MAG: WG repeat-containing protein [Oscillospiraceae bacterium]|nr:WG repeat-containing protein [Oscillospiraceae bacterium]
MKRGSLFLLLAFVLSLVGCSSKEPLNLPVKTNFSFYEQKEAYTALYTRLSPEPLTELIPSENYGTLYPFIGARKTYVSEEGYTMHQSEFYGFTDATGRIIVDPVYSDVALLTGGENGACLPFWVLTKDKPYSGDLFAYSSHRAIASADGSFVSGFDYSYIYGYPDCIVTQSLDRANPVYELYDHSMRLLFSTADLPFSHRIQNAQYHSNGLFLLRLQEEEGFAYYFMDREGDLAFGPYMEAYGFSSGWAAVRLSNEKWTYIDPTGRLMERQFEECDMYYNSGYTVVQTPDRTEILDQEGQTLISLPNYQHLPSLKITEHGIFLSSLQAPDRYYSFDGTLLYETTDKTWFPEYMVYLSEEDPSAPYLYHVELQKKLTLPPLTEDTILSPSSPWIHTGFNMGLSYYDRKDLSATHYLVSPDLELLSVSKEHRPELISEQPGERSLPFVALPGEEGTELFGPEGKLLGLSPMADFHIGRIYEGDYLSLSNEFCTKLYTQNGELVFCYPFAAAMED